MSDPAEKSTEVPAGPADWTEVAPHAVLDGRLGLHHRREEWLAVSDLHFDFRDSFRTEGFLFHHRHLKPPPGADPDSREGETAAAPVEVTGHLHPTVRFDDGADASRRLPAFVRETHGHRNRERWIPPTYSPWAGRQPLLEPRRSGVSPPVGVQPATGLRSLFLNELWNWLS